MIFTSEINVKQLENGIECSLLNYIACFSIWLVNQITFILVAGRTYFGSRKIWVSFGFKLFIWFETSFELKYYFSYFDFERESFESRLVGCPKATRRFLRMLRVGNSCLLCICSVFLCLVLLCNTFVLILATYAVGGIKFIRYDFFSYKSCTFNVTVTIGTYFMHMILFYFLTSYIFNSLRKLLSSVCNYYLKLFISFYFYLARFLHTKVYKSYKFMFFYDDI